MILSRILAVSTLILAGCLLPIEAGATVFSSEGYGWWWDEVDPAARGRGGTSIAVAGYGVTGGVNPAVVASSDLSYGYASYGGEIWNVEGVEGKFLQRSDQLPQFGGLIALPLGIRIGGMLRVQTDATYEREQTIQGESPYTVLRRGKGGWNRLQFLIAGKAPGELASWGVGIARIQGSVKEDWEYDFTGTGTRDARQVIEGRLKGGWIGSAGLLIEPLEAISVGVVGALGGTSRLIQETEVLAGGSYSSTMSGKQEFPSQWGLGLKASPFTNLSISVDVMQSLWGGAGLRVESGAPKIKPFRDATFLGFGLEYSKGPPGESARTLRAGFYDSTSYLEDAVGTQVKEQALTLGYREKIGKGRSALDIAIEAGKRGDLVDLGVEESFLRISAGVSYSSVVREY